MSGWGELAAFAGVIAIGQFSPGPDFLLLTRTALAKGGRAGAWTAAGIASGLTLHAALAMGGVSLLLVGDSILAQVLRTGAGVYLAWLGVALLKCAWNNAGAAEMAANGEIAGDAISCWRRGALCNVFNPKVALFFAATAAPFLTPGHSPWWPWLLGAVIVVQGFVLWVAWGWALQWAPLKRRYRQAGRWIDGIFGIALLCLAARVVAGLF